MKGKKDKTIKQEKTERKEKKHKNRKKAPYEESFFAWENQNLHNRTSSVGNQPLSAHARHFPLTGTAIVSLRSPFLSVDFSNRSELVIKFPLLFHSSISILSPFSI